jgi:hypothetical protein
VTCEMIDYFARQVGLVGRRIGPKGVADDKMKLIESFDEGIPSFVLENITVGRTAACEVLTLMNTSIVGSRNVL